MFALVGCTVQVVELPVEELVGTEFEAPAVVDMVAVPAVVEVAGTEIAELAVVEVAGTETVESAVVEAGTEIVESVVVELAGTELAD